MGISLPILKLFTIRRRTNILTINPIPCLTIAPERSYCLQNPLSRLLTNTPATLLPSGYVNKPSPSMEPSVNFPGMIRHFCIQVHLLRLYDHLKIPLHKHLHSKKSLCQTHSKVPLPISSIYITIMTSIFAIPFFITFYKIPFIMITI